MVQLYGHRGQLEIREGMNPLSCQLFGPTWVTGVVVTLRLTKGQRVAPFLDNTGPQNREERRMRATNADGRGTGAPHGIGENEGVADDRIGNEDGKTTQPEGRT